MSEGLGYLSVAELEALSLDELQALWELVPTDRQKSYRAAYDREVRGAGAIGSDVLEGQVAATLLERYQSSALVPIGSRWARTPQRVQAAAQENELPETGEGATPATTGKPSPQLVAIFGMLIVVLVGFLLFRVVGGGGGEIDPESTAEPSATPTAAVSPTPTPLALEAQDDVITGGDSERAVAYPVNLQVALGADAPARVWVVQRRAVRAAEWRYDPNPDIASFINGMSVRPVIGIPYSAANAALFDALEQGASFQLTLNTGAILRYEFADKRAVLRSETDIFRQVGPGLVLVLIGETDADGLPTATRTLVTARYPAAQELGRLDALLASVPTPILQATPQPTPTPVPTAYLDVQVIAISTQADTLTARLRIYNGGASLQTLTADDIVLSLGYAPDPTGPQFPADGLTPLTLQPGQAADVTLVWPWAGEPFGALQIGVHPVGVHPVGAWRFGIDLAS